MSDQTDTKQVTWQDLEVAEEQEITEWEEGNEPTPAELKSDSLQGVLILHGVSKEEFLEAIAENKARVLGILQSYPILSTPAGEITWGTWVAEMSVSPVDPGAAFCTPSRNPLTLAEYEQRLHDEND